MQQNTTVERTERTTLIDALRPEDMKKWIVECIPVGSRRIVHAGDFDDLLQAHAKQDELIAQDPRQTTIVRPNRCT
jgi:hypothetical protein